jgi:hypothetical protein
MLSSLRTLFRSVQALDARLERIQSALGRLETLARTAAGGEELAAHEFGVFSQWGEDGILQHLLARVPIAHPLFVEFGVESYVESNTRFLLTNSAWSGLVLDGSAEHVESIKRDPIYWRYRLKAVAAFVTRDNINGLLAEHGARGDIGLLSIDIDGNDYWVWQAIQGISPRLVVVEYNSLFGPSAPVTVPYRADFVRGREHHSNLYYGASLAALAQLGADKGYVLVGSNRAGNNAFFVRRDLAAGLPAPTAAEALRQASFRESRDAEGRLTFLEPPAARALIAALPLVEVPAGRALRVGDLQT